MITKTIIENVLIIAAEGFWILSNSAQLRRLVKTRNIQGLSAPNQTLNAAGNVAWVTYFTSRHLFVPVVTNVTMLVITTATLAYLLGNKKQLVKGLLAIAIISPLTSYLLISFTTISGWVGVVYNFVASLPWLIHIIKTKRTSGISEKSLFFVYGAILCTLTYGWLTSSLPLQVSTILGLVTTSIVLRYYYRYRKL